MATLMSGLERCECSIWPQTLALWFVLTQTHFSLEMCSMLGPSCLGYFCSLFNNTVIILAMSSIRPAGATSSTLISAWKHAQEHQLIVLHITETKHKDFNRETNYQREQHIFRSYLCPMLANTWFSSDIIRPGGQCCESLRNNCYLFNP